MKREATLLLAVVVTCLCGTVAAADGKPEGGPAEEAARLEAIKRMEAEEDALRKAVIDQVKAEQAAVRAGMREAESRATRRRKLSAEEERALAELSELAGGGTGKAPRVVLVPAGAMEPERAAQLLEDLSIMSRVLDKALVQALGDEHMPQTAPDGFASSGFGPQPVFGSQGDQPKQTLYLDGYGAVFLLNVRFPLIGPETGEPEEPEREPESLWEQTKREMREPRREARPSFAPDAGPSGFGGGPFATGARPAFRPELVERLRGAILASLREASNVRSLKPDEAVSVVVLGSDTPVQTDAFGNALGSGALARGGVLTMHVRKADIDACAEEDVPVEGFRERVHMAIGVGLPQPATGAARGVRPRR